MLDPESTLGKMLAALESEIPDTYGQALYALAVGIHKLELLPGIERERIYKYLDGARDVDLARLPIRERKPAKCVPLRVIDGGKSKEELARKAALDGLKRFSRHSGVPALVGAAEAGKPIVNKAMRELAARLTIRLRESQWDVVAVVDDEDDRFGWEPKEDPPASEQADCDTLERDLRAAQAWLDEHAAVGAATLDISVVTLVEADDMPEFAGAIVSLESPAKGAKTLRIIVRLPA